jgi:beta-phosphoglucomutase family hydrolase
VILGLPRGITVCLFDLDGVLTQTAKVHAAAWKQMFDEFLRGWAAGHGQPSAASHGQASPATHGQAFAPFDALTDYDQYVDGKPRYDGVRSFLQARGIELPEGSADDPPTAQTVHGLGNRKNELVLKMIREQGVEPYPGSVRYVHAVIDAGLKRAVVSSSANTHDVLRAAGIADLFDHVVDGVTAERENLKGKPAPDTYLAGAHELGVEPVRAAVFEDALAGVEAGRAGRFGFVVGVDRVGQAAALKAHGADTVVADLTDLLDGTT